MHEAAALCLKVAEDFPAASLMPPLGTAARGTALEWLFYLTNTLQADCSVFNYARRYASTAAGIKQVRTEAGARLGSMLGHIDRQLRTGGPWLAGESLSVADYYLLMVAGWLEQFKIPDPPSIRPSLKAYLRRAQALPAPAHAYRLEGHGPYF
jgi:glutathione S-transferase